MNMRSKLAQFAPTSLRTKVSLAFGSVALALIVLITLLNGWMINREWQGISDNLAHEAAARVSDQVNADFERRLLDLSQIATHLRVPGDADHMQNSIELLQGMHPDFAWISFTNAQGQIVASTNRQILGANVNQLNWFRNAQRGIGPGPDANGERGMVSSRLVNETQYVFDFSVPVYDLDGRFIGALVAELLSDQTQPIFARAIGANQSEDLQGLLIDASGMILSGPDTLAGQHIEFQQDTSGGELDLTRGQLSDGTNIDVIIGPSTPSQVLSRFNWYTVTVLRSSSWATSLEQVWPALAIGGGLGLMFVTACYILSARMIAPFVEVIRSADRMRVSDQRALIASKSPYSEVTMLSSSLNTLMSGLTAKEDELRSLNDTLNHKVSERTLELVLIADSLQNEIAQRTQLQQQHEQLMAELLALASTDSLTKTFNRRTLFQLGEEEFARARRMNLPISIIMLDIDKFKQVNDTFGHAAGDEVLEKVAENFRGVTRESDIIGRYGGEEFIFVLPGTDEEGALLVAERLRKSVVEASRETSIADRWQITASLGVAAISPHTNDFATLVRRADDASYDAKHAGRNRIAMAA